MWWQIFSVFACNVLIIHVVWVRGLASLTSVCVWERECFREVCGCYSLLNLTIDVNKESCRKQIDKGIFLTEEETLNSLYINQARAQKKPIISLATKNILFFGVNMRQHVYTSSRIYTHTFACTNRYTSCTESWWRKK